MNETKFQVGRDTWEMILVPRVQFKRIHKEKGTHGKLYAAWTVNSNIAWISQSVTALCKMIFLICQQKCYSSSFYRYLRGEQKKPANKDWIVKGVANAEALNELLAGFEFFQVCSKNLDFWELEESITTSQHHNSPV
jgi:virulence-associated protein VapD